MVGCLAMVNLRHSWRITGKIPSTYNVSWAQPPYETNMQSSTSGITDSTPELSSLASGVSLWTPLNLATDDSPKRLRLLNWASSVDFPDLPWDILWRLRISSRGWKSGHLGFESSGLHLDIALDSTTPRPIHCSIPVGLSIFVVVIGAGVIYPCISAYLCISV